MGTVSEEARQTELTLVALARLAVKTDVQTARHNLWRGTVSVDGASIGCHGITEEEHLTRLGSARFQPLSAVLLRQRPPL